MDACDSQMLMNNRISKCFDSFSVVVNNSVEYFYFEHPLCHIRITHDIPNVLLCFKNVFD